MNEGRYQVTLSHYGHEISQEGFTSFPEALGRAKSLRATWSDAVGIFVRLENTELAEGVNMGDTPRYHDGLTQEERDQWLEQA